MMRKTLRKHAWISAAVLVCAVLSAAPELLAKPITLPVHGRLAATGGGPVADGKYAMAFRLYADDKATKPLWQEKAIGVTVAGGMFHWLLGPQATLALDDALFAGKSTLHFGVSVSGETELPRVPLGNVAFAAWARGAGWAQDLKCGGCVDGSELALASVASKHIGFAYAGAKVKGGPATSALTAVKADSATKADSAA